MSLKLALASKDDVGQQAARRRWLNALHEKANGDMAKSRMRSIVQRIAMRREHLKRRTRSIKGDVLKTLSPAAFSAPTIAAFVGTAETYLWRSDGVDAVARAAAEHPRSAEAVASAVTAAEAALQLNRFSVMDKLWTPPSGDKHDYLTGPAYWWPDPNSTDGLPWTFRDGHMNPVRFGEEYDLTRLDDLAQALKMLALAWRFTGRREFAEHSAMLVKAWFLDPATRMSPHLAFAQTIPGRTRVTGTGIIETLRFVTIIDAVGLAANSETLSSEEAQQLRHWFADYLTWLRKSPNGQLERATNNNHGLSHDIQSLTYALFSGDRAYAEELAAEAPRRRVYNQIRSDGSLPEEVRRKEAFFYVAYGIGFMFDLARLAEHVGLDLWRYRAPDGSGIETAVQAMTPYMLDRTPWPFGGDRVPAPELYAIALQAARAYGDEELAETAREYARSLPLQPIDLIMPPPGFS